VGVRETPMRVDFRYPGETCLMLMLDGHVEQQTRFEHLADGTAPDEDYDDLEEDRGVRVTDLTKRWARHFTP
jgi:hypothetical protein